MGLDMYLSKKTFVKNWDHTVEKHTITIDGPESKNIRPERITYIIEEVGYWRKANAIHNWFVQHCQKGRDECQETYVSRTELAELRDTCKRVLENPLLAETELPPTRGFFFGSTKVDEYYMDDLRDTVKLLDALLSEPPHGDFYYRSSW